jgi:hypothetical protein
MYGQMGGSGVLGLRRCDSNCTKRREIRRARPPLSLLPWWSFLKTGAPQGICRAYSPPPPPPHPRPFWLSAKARRHADGQQILRECLLIHARAPCSCVDIGNSTASTSLHSVDYDVPRDIDPRPSFVAPTGTATQSKVLHCKLASGEKQDFGDEGAEASLVGAVK